VLAVYQGFALAGPAIVSSGQRAGGDESSAGRPAAFWPPVVSIVGSFADREAFLAPRNQPAHHRYLCVENSLALKNQLAVLIIFGPACLSILERPGFSEKELDSIKRTNQT
jgi:hypothetical protein